MTLAAFARLIGVSKQAVAVAVRRGRLAKSVKRGPGGPRINDPELARAEWQRNASKPTKARAAAAPPRLEPTPLDAMTVTACGDDDELIALAIVPDEDDEFDPQRHVGVVMTAADAVDIGRWLTSAAENRLKGDD